MPLFKAETLSIDTDESGVALLKLDVPGKTVNVIDRQVLADLQAALDCVSQESNLKLLVIRGMKKSGFLAGADIQAFTEIKTAEQARALSRTGQELFDKLELLPIPTLAVIHGPCLGGGLELALACDYRLVVDSVKTQMGLPEVRLGLLPAWGGTQRLPRTVGLEHALQMILGAKHLSAKEALKWKLADGIARTEAELRAQLDQWIQKAIQKGKHTRRGLPLHGIRQKLMESTALGRKVIFATAQRLLKRRVPDDMPAPFEAFDAIRVGVKQGINAGMAQEREGAGRLALTAASHHLINVFLQRESARKREEESASRVEKVGVVGAGTMGAGIAQLAALRGHEVHVQEVDPEALGRGVLAIESLFQQALAKGVLTPQQYAERLNAVRGTITWDQYSTVDLVVEAALENLEVKKKLFKILEEKTRANAILATNTSSLSVTALQEHVEYPERVAGLHFFNPVHKMELVEVIQGQKTSEETAERLMQWSREIGKTPVLVKDSPGFLVNRILMPYINEAVLLVQEGMEVEKVDRLMKRFGMPMMGPLELLDQVGLDVAGHIAESMRPFFGNRFAINPAFERLRGTQWLGRKSGAGFYRYKGKKKKVNHNLLRILKQDAPEDPMKGLPAGARAQQARDRMVLVMVNEAIACLGEGIVAEPQTIDLAMILGTGWAPHRGGPLHYADDRGLSEVAEALEGLSKRYGPRFEPCEKLKQLVGSGGSLYGK